MSTINPENNTSLCPSCQNCDDCQADAPGDPNCNYIPDVPAFRRHVIVVPLNSSENPPALAD